MTLYELFSEFEFTLWRTANRTYPFFRKVIKRYSRCNSVIRISHCWIVDIATNDAYILVHFFISFLIFYERFYFDYMIFFTKNQHNVRMFTHKNSMFSANSYTPIYCFLRLFRTNKNPANVHDSRFTGSFPFYSRILIFFRLSSLNCPVAI